MVDNIESGAGTNCYQDCVRPYCALCAQYGVEGVYQCPNDNNMMEDKFFFVLNVRDGTSGARIICSGEGAQELLDTEQARASFLGKAARIVNKWCDVHVKGCDIDGRVSLFITSTIIKTAPAFI